MNEIIATTLLWFCFGSSDKVYKAQIIKTPAGYILRASWGRRGKTMQTQDKGLFHSHWDATQAYHSLVASKTAKGYRKVDSVPA